MVDMVPKAIMLNLVTQAKEELQRELLSELYKAEVLDDLLQESDYTKERRQECKKMIEVKNKIIINETLNGIILIQILIIWYDTILYIGITKSR